MPNKTKIGYGQKADITSAIESEKLNEMDIVITSDTDEIAFIDPSKEVNFLKSRTTQSYTLNGTTLGSLANGSTIPADIDMDGLLKIITQKAIPATYSKPSVSIGNSGGTGAGAYEAGTSITPKLRASFTKNDSKGLSTIKILKGSEEVATGTASPLDYTGEAFVIGDESITFKATAAYQEANVKQNNLGDDSKENWFAAGTATSGNYTFTGQRKMFYGTGVGELPEITSDFVRGLANNKMNPAAGTAFTINVAVGQQHIVFAYPSNLRDVSKVFYVEGNDPNLAANFTKNLVQVADARGGENGLKEYKVYSMVTATPCQAVMTLEVTL